jgi:hypothetical protein
VGDRLVVFDRFGPEQSDHHRFSYDVHQHTEENQPAEHGDHRDQSPREGDWVDVAVSNGG